MAIFIGGRKRNRKPGRIEGWNYLKADHTVAAIGGRRWRAALSSLALPRFWPAEFPNRPPRMGRRGRDTAARRPSQRGFEAVESWKSGGLSDAAGQGEPTAFNFQPSTHKTFNHRPTLSLTRLSRNNNLGGLDFLM
jgi:hypothetical protein